MCVNNQGGWSIRIFEESSHNHTFDIHIKEKSKLSSSDWHSLWFQNLRRSQTHRDVPQRNRQTFQTQDNLCSPTIRRSVFILIVDLFSIALKRRSRYSKSIIKKPCILMTENAMSSSLCTLVLKKTKKTKKTQRNGWMYSTWLHERSYWSFIMWPFIVWLRVHKWRCKIQLDLMSFDYFFKHLHKLRLNWHGNLL